MGFDVKITTKISILDLIAPFTCRGCGHRGEILCKCCKKYILRGGLGICPKCKKPVDKKASCACLKLISPVFVVGYREGVLMQLVEDYKFKSVRRTAEVLAEMVDDALPDDLGTVSVIPLPTIPKHIRERGFDHTLLLAKKLCKLRPEFTLAKVLERDGNTTQIGKDAETRKRQARKAYKVRRAVDPEKTYLLLDDVWTTGASMEAAAEVLRVAGAKKMMGVVLMITR